MTLSQLQGELVGVQSSLFSLGLELEASQRSLSQSQRQGDDLARFKDRLNADLQEALQHRGETEKHNQVCGNLKAAQRCAVCAIPQARMKISTHCCRTCSAHFTELALSSGLRKKL